MFTWKFWKDALERAISTAAQAAIASNLVVGVVWGVHWDVVAGISGTAAALSLLKALAASGIGRKDSASLVE